MERTVKPSIGPLKKEVNAPKRFNIRPYTYPLILFSISIAFRLPLLMAAPYGDESAHFTMARTLGFMDSSTYWIDQNATFRLYPLVVGRPVFAAFMWPGTIFGFTGFRFLGIVYSSLLAPLLFLLGRQIGMRKVTAVALGILVSLHPAFIVWGARVFPDTIMSMLVLLGFIFLYKKQHTWAFVSLILACLAKETALPVVAGVAAFYFVSALKDFDGNAPLKPQFSKFFLFLIATVVGTFGVFGSYLIVPRLPGWTEGGTLIQSLDVISLWHWVAIGPIFALWIPKIRPVATAYTFSITFYLAFVVLKDGNVNAWYAILPGLLGMLVVFSAIENGIQASPRVSAVSKMFAIWMGLAVVVAIFGISSASSLFHVGTHQSDAGTLSSIRFVQEENAWLSDAIEFHAKEAPESVLNLDLGWFWVADPFTGTGSTAFSFVSLSPLEENKTAELVSRAEESDLTWVQSWGSPFQLAFQGVYAECHEASFEYLHAYKIEHCPGLQDELQRKIDLYSQEENAG